MVLDGRGSRLELEPRLGEYLAAMLEQMSDRGPDSAGVAVYRDPAPSGSSKVTVYSFDPEMSWDVLRAELGATFGGAHESGVRANHAVFVVESEADEVEEIAAHDIPRRMEAAAIGYLEQRGVRISVRVRRLRVGRIDADIVTWKTFDQLALCCDRPFFKVRGQPVGISQYEIRRVRVAEFFAERCGADETGDHRG